MAILAPWHVPREPKVDNMKRTARSLALAIAVTCAPFAHADAYDCFPMCPQAPAAAAKPLALCDVPAVREAAQLNARLNDDLKPVKQLYDMATNPTGFAVRMVDEHVVHIPKAVGYALDPKGAVKAELIKRAREELKKQAGLKDECRAPAAEAIDETQDNS